MRDVVPVPSPHLSAASKCEKFLELLAEPELPACALVAVVALQESATAIEAEAYVGARPVAFAFLLRDTSWEVRAHELHN